MCGLFGIAGPGIIKQDLEMLKELAYTSGLRGLDGTGIFQGKVTKRRVENFTVSKMGSDVSYFQWFNTYSKEGNRRICNDLSCNFIVGHVRYGTKGSISNENAHPFTVGHIIGCHNGTLWDSKYHHREKTDSEMMFQDIAERGIEKVLSELTPSSAYAITMFDWKNFRLFFAKNEKRPLAFTFNTKRDVMYWASESPMLRFIAHRNHIEIGKVCRFSDNHVYSFNPLEIRKSGQLMWFKRALPEPEEKSIPIFQVDMNKLPWMDRVQKKDDNVVILEDLRKEKKGPTSKNGLIKFCITCKDEMDLFDQYEGEEIEPSVYRCKTCTDVIQQLADFNSKGQVH